MTCDWSLPLTSEVLPGSWNPRATFPLAGPLDWSLDLTVVRDKGVPLGKANGEKNVCPEIKATRSNVVFLTDLPLTWLLFVVPPGMTDPDDSSSLYCGTVSFLPGLVTEVISLWLSCPQSPKHKADEPIPSSFFTPKTRQWTVFFSPFFHWSCQLEGRKERVCQLGKRHRWMRVWA